MKEYFKWLKFWLWVFSILLVLWAVTFFVIKSRTATDPGLWDNGSSLYTSVNETLTAAKRNALVKRTTGREDVSTSDTTTLFDMNCERRRKMQWANGDIWWYYPAILNNWWQRLSVSFANGNASAAPTASYYRKLLYTAKSTLVENDWTSRTLLKLQKKCQ